MVRFKHPRMWKGKRVDAGDPVMGTDKERADLLDCGLAYEDEPQVPTMSNTKKEIEAYLDENGIEYDEYSTKSELLELI